MSAPPKQKRAPAESALPKLRLLAAYHATAFLARVLGAPLWFFEQRALKSRISWTTRVCGHE